MDHVLVEMDDDFGGNVDLGRGVVTASGLGVPIEARLRSLAIGILYEACRVQKFDVDELRMFDDTFIERMFDLVELTRNVDDETLNYSVIKLIVALNEQFMVAAMPSSAVDPQSGKRKKERKGYNKILEVLMRRVHSSKTFGENIIFMLNRASNTEEDLVMQLLLLKILYVLFTTPGTQEYFYTNDLRVLVDVFLRELVDLPEESEALRHTYLRVLNPLLTNTQLRDIPYKATQIRRTLQVLISQDNMREVTPTTKRLVERCLEAEWCKSLPPDPETSIPSKPIHPALNSVFTPSFPTLHSHSAVHLASVDDEVLEPPQPAFRFKTLHKSLSAEVLQPPTIPNADHQAAGGEHHRSGSNPQTVTNYRKPPAIPEGAMKPRKKSFIQSSDPDVLAAVTVHRTALPEGSSHHPNMPHGKSPLNTGRRPSLGNADLPRDRKPPPPVPKLDRTSLDSHVPPKIVAGSANPLVHRREPPAVPSKAKKPKTSGTISDSPLSKLAYSATTVAR
ncbi:hypothetical protein CPB86DRAFT_694417 [Serendipita vermifera]|nr:hypothetical protein CPB86DRAFT_694417 [Serendipita vermifera]